jgi:uncharacterized DUF497 family protein
MYTESVAIDWDPEKAKSNIEKHGIRFPDAVLALDDPRGITIIDSESDPAEQRFATLGLDGLGRLLVVVYTWRGDNIRLISARPAEPHERKEYRREGL